MTGAASSQRAVTKTITPSPPWTAAQLSAPAGNNWLEYYGSLNGNRYSSLNQITTSNVSSLKQVWHMSLGTCTAAIIAGNPVIPGAPRGATNNPTNCGSMESNPVAVDGVLYTIERSARPGLRDRRGDRQHHLEYTPSYAGEILNNGRAFSPGSGGRRAGRRGRRGQGLLRPSGRPPRSRSTRSPGRQVWETSVGSYKNNAKISNAPIYVNGMVLVGDGSGDSGGNSPSLQAFRAANGARVWSWSPIPSPGQPGLQDLDEQRQGRERQHPLRRRLVLGVPDRRHQAQHARSSAPATRSRGTRAAPVRTSTPTRSSRSTSTRVS